MRLNLTTEVKATKEWLIPNLILMQRSGLILVHAAWHCTAKLPELTTLRGAVGLTA